MNPVLAAHHMPSQMPLTLTFLLFVSLTGQGLLFLSALTVCGFLNMNSNTKKQYAGGNSIQTIIRSCKQTKTVYLLISTSLIKIVSSLFLYPLYLFPLHFFLSCHHDLLPSNTLETTLNTFATPWQH